MGNKPGRMCSCVRKDKAILWAQTGDISGQPNYIWPGKLPPDPLQPPALLCRDLPPLRHQPLIARVCSEQKTLVFHRLVISWDIIGTINILYRKGWLQKQCLFNRLVQLDLIHSWNFPRYACFCLGALPVPLGTWQWQKVKEFVDATGLCGVCGVICNQRRHLRAARGD